MKNKPIMDEQLFYKMQESLNLKFGDISLLQLSMTHSSLSTGKKHIKNNQRLELLGDSVLGLIVTEHLYLCCKQYQEGKMTKMKNYLVSQPVLSHISRDLKLGHYLLMSYSEDSSGGREKDSTLADAFEALVAAIYLDQGFNRAKDFVIPLIIAEYERFFSDSEFVTDYKSELQYIVQKELKICPDYILIKEEGPHHNRMFFVELHIQGKFYAKGEAKTKKQAEQNAAEDLYKRLQEGEVKLPSHNAP